MSEVAEKAAEATAEVVEEAVDGVVDVVTVVRNNPKALVAVGLLGVVAGGLGGYFAAKSKLRSHYEEIARQEIAEARVFYAGVYKTDDDGEVLSPQEVLSQRHGAEAAAEALRGYRGESPAQSEEDLIAEAKDAQGGPWDEAQDEAQIRKIEEARFHSVSVDKEPGPHDGTVEVVEKEETINVFEEPTFDLQEELKYRTEDKPYIITHDEYFAAEKDYDTSSLTYYEQDDTLADEQDKPIREVDEIIGTDHLVRFGTASGDRNIVYVRNDRLETDYEVIKTGGSYVEEVLGMLENDEPHLKHSNRNAQLNRRREFRRGDV